MHHCSHGVTGFPSPLPDNNGRLHSDDPSREPNMIRSSHVTYVHTCKVFDVRNNHGEALRHINFNKAPELCIYIDLNRIVNDAYHVCMSPSSFCRVISLLLGSGVNNLAPTHLCFIDRDTGKDVPGLE